MGSGSYSFADYSAYSFIHKFLSIQNEAEKKPVVKKKDVKIKADYPPDVLKEIAPSKNMYDISRNATPMISIM